MRASSDPDDARFRMTKTPSHIAVLRTDRLGDMVLTLPMFNALRSKYPQAHLTLITRSYVRPLVHEADVIDDVIYLDEDHRPLREILRIEGIDTIFFPRPQFSEAWEAFRAGVKRRIGSGYRWYSMLFTTRIKEHRSDASYHEAEYNVRMVSHAFGGEQLPVALVSPRHENVATKSTPPWIIIHPGSGGSAHDWPAERFGQLAKRLSDELSAHIIVTGIGSERSVCDAVMSVCPEADDLCGSLDLDDMIDLIASSCVLCSNSTGVLHIAAALGVGVVGFYPSTPSMSAKRWGPYTEHAVVLESGPSDDMSTISVDAAVAAVKSLL